MIARAGTLPRTVSPVRSYKAAGSQEQRGHVCQMYASRAVKRESVTATLFGVGRILFVSCSYPIVVRTYPSCIPSGGGKIRPGTKTQQETVTARCARSPRPPPFYHTSRNLRFLREPALRLGFRVIRGRCALCYGVGANRQRMPVVIDGTV